MLLHSIAPWLTLASLQIPTLLVFLRRLALSFLSQRSTCLAQRCLADHWGIKACSCIRFPYALSYPSKTIDTSDSLMHVFALLLQVPSSHSTTFVACPISSLWSSHQAVESHFQLLHSLHSAHSILPLIFHNHWPSSLFARIDSNMSSPVLLSSSCPLLCSFWSIQVHCQVPFYIFVVLPCSPGHIIQVACALAQAEGLLTFIAVFVRIALLAWYYSWMTVDYLELWRSMISM